MAIVTCTCTKEIKDEAPRAFAASKIIVSTIYTSGGIYYLWFRKVAMAHEANVAAEAVIVLPYRAFFIL